MKMYEFRLGFHWSLFLSFEIKYSSNGSEKDLEPSRRQAIFLTNDG